MAKWTKWRKIAEKDEYDDRLIDWDGPSCYELGVKAKNGREIIRVYVGHTKNEFNRILMYARCGAHVPKKINKILRKGFRLYYRAQAKNTVLQAEKMEHKLLSERYYGWNTQLR